MSSSSAPEAGPTARADGATPAGARTGASGPAPEAGEAAAQGEEGDCPAPTGRPGPTLLRTCDDIGRHNAIDKVLGWALRHRWPPGERDLLLTTGRLSSEIVVKAARGRFPFLVSHSAPTVGALQLADRLGLTVIGFVRGERFNVYTHPERVIGATGGDRAAPDSGGATDSSGAPGRGPGQGDIAAPGTDRAPGQAGAPDHAGARSGPATGPGGEPPADDRP